MAASATERAEGTGVAVGVGSGVAVGTALAAAAAVALRAAGFSFGSWAVAIGATMRMRIATLQVARLGMYIDDLRLKENVVADRGTDRGLSPEAAPRAAPGCRSAPYNAAARGATLPPRNGQPMAAYRRASAAMELR